MDKDKAHKIVKEEEMELVFNVAEAAGTVTNEVLSRLGSRLSRIAVDQGLSR